ncbi:MAG: branched-chain amino acid ABC transporter permease, partial [Acidimicrobiales bacterium]
AGSAGAAPAPGAGDRWQSRWGLGVAIIVLAALMPRLGASQYIVSVGLQVEIMICLALGLNIVVGYAGLLDLGFAAFFAIGAYTTGLLTTKAHWTVLASLPVGVACALVGAVVIGVPTLRLRSDYLAIVTLGFGEIIQTVANNLQFTGGPTGIFAIPPLTLGGFTVGSTRGYYYVYLVMTVIFVGAVYQLRRSRLGRAWLCIREDEDAAEAMGIKTRRYKLYAYMGGAIIGALTGCMYAPALTAISPPSFGFAESLLILMAVSIGGMGSIWGALIGGAIVEGVPELLRGFSQARLLVFGFILIVMMILRPQGIWPEGTGGLPQILRRMWPGRRVVAPGRGVEAPPAAGTGAAAAAGGAPGTGGVGAGAGEDGPGHSEVGRP